MAGVEGATRRAARAFSPELDLTTTERLTLAYITIRCGTAPVQGGSTHVCIAKLADVALATGRSIRTARYACRSLEAKGYITSELVDRGGRLPVGHGGGFHADRETLVVRTLRDLKAAKVEGLHGAASRAFNCALKDGKGKNLAASRRAVLAALLIHAGEDGWCWPSYATLGAMTSLTERTVGAAVRELVAAGHVVKKLIAPTWANPGWKVRYRPTPTRVAKCSEPKVSSPLPGNSFLPTRQPLPTKEIREGEPLAAALGTAVQLDLFAPRRARPGTRAAEVEVVMDAAKAALGCDITQDHQARAQARLGEGLHAAEIVVALHAAHRSPGEKSGLLGRVLRSKSVIVAYLETMGEGERHRELTRHGFGTDADRDVRDESVSLARKMIAKGLAIFSSPPNYARQVKRA